MWITVRDLVRGLVTGSPAPGRAALPSHHASRRGVTWAAAPAVGRTDHPRGSEDR
mgnify:FL=1|jgi:hypothetical protein